MGNQPSTIFATSASAERDRIRSLRLRPLKEIFPRGTNFSHAVAVGQIQEKGYVSVQMMLSESGETCLELRHIHFREFCEWFITIRESFAEMTQSEFAEYVSYKIHTLNITERDGRRERVTLTLLRAL